jgi:hypothetical protein
MQQSPISAIGDVMQREINHHFGVGASTMLDTLSVIHAKLRLFVTSGSRRNSAGVSSVTLDLAISAGLHLKLCLRIRAHLNHVHGEREGRVMLIPRAVRPASLD